MPLTNDQISQIQADVELAAQAAAPFVSLLGPAASAGLIVGSAIAKQVPSLVAIVQKWVAGLEPTDEERAAFKAELDVLSNPNLP